MTLRLRMTGEGLKELSALKNLTTLSLWGARVTDVGLKELAALRSLRSLDVRGTGVTEAGMKELQKALPGCEITR